LAEAAPVQAGNPNRSIGFGLVLVMASLYGFWGVFKQFQTSQISTKWPVAAGVIEEAQLVESTSTRSRSKAWTLKLRYLYTIEGKEYAGSAIHLGSFPSYGDEIKALEAKRKYLVGNETPVYYNPEDLSEAVLEPGAGAAGESMGLSAFLLGIVLLLGGTAMFQGISRLRPKPVM